MKLKWIAALIAGTLALHAPAQLRPKPHFTLRADRLKQAIVKALAEQGRLIDPIRISLLGSVIASDPDPILDVRSIQPLGSSTSTTFSVMLACHQSTTCLPFYAIISGRAIPTDSPLLSAKPTKSIMRTGTKATLLMEDDDTHLQLSVISLEAGPAGRTIRVRSTDRKQFYSAEIISPTTLRGHF
jgi:hypothetical protein